MGKFKTEDAEKLLIACHRCCCTCHRFRSVKMELDHIVQQAEDGPDTHGNAMPVCLECHAEIHSYNPNHPRGPNLRPANCKCAHQKSEQETSQSVVSATFRFVRFSPGHIGIGSSIFSEF